MVVPARSYVELTRILADVEEPVDIILAQSRNQVIFKVETTELVSRLIDGQFPNYQSVLPTSHSTRAVVDRDELLKAVRLSALIASSAANVVRLGFGGEDNPSGISVAAAADIGDAEGQVDVQIDGRPREHRLQRPLHGRGAAEHGGRAPGHRAQRPPLARRPEARGRPRLRPRHHAGAHALLSHPTPCARPAVGRGRAATGDLIDARPLTLADRLPELRAARDHAERRPARRRRPQRGGQDQPPRVTRRPLERTFASQRRRCRDGALGQRRSPAAAPSSSAAERDMELEVVIAAPGHGGRAQAHPCQRRQPAGDRAGPRPAHGALRARGHAAGGRLAVAAAQPSSTRWWRSARSPPRP